ncbi:MAG: hypothetical protein WA958_03480 [Tunicatimonas sp.]
MIQALESNGQIDKNGHLQLDNALPVKDKRVKVIVLFPNEEDISDSQWLQSARGNEVFNFLDDPEEDIYSVSDGEDFKDEI